LIDFYDNNEYFNSYYISVKIMNRNSEVQYMFYQNELKNLSLPIAVIILITFNIILSIIVVHIAEYLHECIKDCVEYYHLFENDEIDFFNQYNNLSVNDDDNNDNCNNCSFIVTPHKNHSNENEINDKKHNENIFTNDEGFNCTCHQCGTVRIYIRTDPTDNNYNNDNNVVINKNDIAVKNIVIAENDTSIVNENENENENENTENNDCGSCSLCDSFSISIQCNNIDNETIYSSQENDHNNCSFSKINNENHFLMDDDNCKSQLDDILLSSPDLIELKFNTDYTYSIKYDDDDDITQIQTVNKSINGNDNINNDNTNNKDSNLDDSIETRSIIKLIISQELTVT